MPCCPEIFIFLKKTIDMAHVKAGGVAKGNKDSVSKRLGVKIYGGQNARSGNIIIRQRGTKVTPGSGTRIGNDHTIFATTDGKVTFLTKMGKQFVSVLPQTS
jgi:large subunit ribosomal protein L27